ncbi:MAG: POT family MFS transporter [bacterium]|jgi:POT family proton-dependent oligopeptide transporter|nr:POT family MFS transporter [bacterium]
MKEKTYLTAPVKSTQMPRGIPYILANEAAERFSFYGMRCILVVFMTQYLMRVDGVANYMGEDQAKAIFHLFVGAVYFTPLLGAIIADAFFGKYRVIFWVSIIYCLGHLALAMIDSQVGAVLFGFVPGVDANKVALFAGLALIAIGSGGIKPCVSANVGDQFGESNKHLIEKVYGWFYFSINLGSFVSTLLTPWLLYRFGPHVAFGVPGIFMALATVAFWMGRYKFVHIPPAGTGFIKEVFSWDSIKSLRNLFIIYVFVAMFWALYDQTGSSWVLQARNMNLEWMGITWQESQIQALNHILIIIFIPLSSFVIYPLINKVFPLTPLRKIGIGMFLTEIAFGFPYWIGILIERGHTPSIYWQLMGYVVLTMAEIFVSITCLEFSYTQAPNKMKSFVMSFYLLSVSMGNFFTSFINSFIQNADGTSKLEGSSYFLFFMVLMLLASIAFVIVSLFYKEQTHIQQEQELEEAV